MKILIKTTKVQFKAKSYQDRTSVEPITSPIEETQQNLLQIQDSSNREIFNERTRNQSLEMRRRKIVSTFSLEQTQAEKNVQKCNLKKVWKLEINCYENKNWNAINCYNLTLSIKKIKLLWKILKWCIQHQNLYHDSNLLDLKFSIPTPFIFRIKMEGQKSFFCIFFEKRNQNLPLRKCVFLPAVSQKWASAETILVCFLNLKIFRQDCQDCQNGQKSRKAKIAKSEVIELLKTF